MKFKLTTLASLSLAALIGSSVSAQTPKPVRIGALVDMSGVYSAMVVLAW